MEKIGRAAGGVRAARRSGCSGFAFKPNTDDLREAPALRLVHDSLRRGGRAVQACSTRWPWRTSGAHVTAPVEYCKNAYDVAAGADALVLVTEWNEFRELDFARLGKRMRGKVFVDCATSTRRERVEATGFVYESVGRGSARALAQEEKLIDGVRIKQLKVIPDERGLLMEMLRATTSSSRSSGRSTSRSPTRAWSRAGTTTRSRPTTSCA